MLIAAVINDDDQWTDRQTELCKSTAHKLNCWMELPKIDFGIHCLFMRSAAAPTRIVSLGGGGDDGGWRTKFVKCLY